MLKKNSQAISLIVQELSNWRKLGLDSKANFEPRRNLAQLDFWIETVFEGQAQPIDQPSKRIKIKIGSNGGIRWIPVCPIIKTRWCTRGISLISDVMSEEEEGGPSIGRVLANISCASASRSANYVIAK